MTGVAHRPAVPVKAVVRHMICVHTFMQTYMFDVYMYVIFIKRTFSRHTGHCFPLEEHITHEIEVVVNI